MVCVTTQRNFPALKSNVTCLSDVLVTWPVYATSIRKFPSLRPATHYLDCGIVGFSNILLRKTYSNLIFQWLSFLLCTWYVRDGDYLKFLWENTGLVLEICHDRFLRRIFKFSVHQRPHTSSKALKPQPKFSLWFIFKLLTHFTKNCCP